MSVELRLGNSWVLQLGMIYSVGTLRVKLGVGMAAMWSQS